VAKDDDKFLFEEILNYVMENDNSTFLIEKALEILKKAKIIFPTMITTESIVWFARENADNITFKYLTENMSSEQKNRLDTILTPRTIR